MSVGEIKRERKKYIYIYREREKYMYVEREREKEEGRLIRFVCTCGTRGVRRVVSEAATFE